MGKRNRERRKVKQKHRRRSATGREHVGPDPGPDRAQILERLVISLSTAAAVATSQRAAELLEQSRGYERELDVAADLAVHEAIRAAWEHGWSPTDLHEIARRRVDADTARYLDEAIVLESRRYSVGTLHPRWRVALDDIAAAVGSSATAPQMRRWAASHSADECSVLTVVLQVLNLLGRIPAMEALLPLPGSHRQLAAVVDEVDEKMLSRVRALLAKAEATEFPDEAEALSAKAQALMVRHSLREAVADHDHGRPSVAAARRVWIDNPYVAAKVALVQAVAEANRCRTVWHKDLGCVVNVGADSDLDVVDLLTTSLLVQASRAMWSPDAGTTFVVSRVRSRFGCPSWSPTPPGSGSDSPQPVRRSPRNCNATTGCCPCWQRATAQSTRRSPGSSRKRSPARFRRTTPSAWGRGARRPTRRCSTSETRSRAE
ncbi:DUF2786 domain-containing protein [Mycolicibacterium vanbaalenii]|uniref:DUF2786 domain-containing protein n=1 Tax=Mycolicibacterium vanbaalenii TaxID=110539 RepID=UPI001F18A730|nr:DUF2786 domain-containing protein [Mycolicibacterium vanbaalenii]